MSKNFELLQEAGFALCATPALTTVESAGTADDVAPATSQALSSLDPAVREEALKLVQRLFLTPDKTAPRVILFVAVDANIGCDWLCVVTAQLLAKSVPGSVCLVEGNFRKPSLSENLGLQSDRGLVESLRQDGSIRGFARQIGSDNFWLLAAGAPAQDSTILLNSDRMRDRLREVRNEFDFVLMNAPPLNAFADGMVLGRAVDGVVLILEANCTNREAAVRATESLKAMNIPVLGAVLNNRTFPIPAAVYKRI